MQHQNRTADGIIAAIATRAHGNVTRSELLEAAVTREEIRQRLDRGSLSIVFPGVYRVGHAAPSTEAHYTAAVKACGKGAVLSGRAAAYLHRLIKGKPPPPEVRTTTERRIKGIKTKRTRNLDPRDTTTARGIPITTVARTLVDLASCLDKEALARACHEAGVLHHTTPRQVDAVLARIPNAPGSRNLREVLHGDVRVTLSKLEKRFLALLAANVLPLPITNKPAGGRRVDCRWPEHNLTVELDSYTFHRSRHAWEQDRRRERQAFARSDQFRRYTRDDLFERPAAMLRELRQLLDDS